MPSGLWRGPYQAAEVGQLFLPAHFLLGGECELHQHRGRTCHTFLLCDAQAYIELHAPAEDEERFAGREKAGPLLLA